MEKIKFTDLSKKQQKSVLEVFESNESINELLFTVDGMCFTKENHAWSHEQTLVQACETDATKAVARRVVLVVREDVGVGSDKKPAKKTK